MKGIILKILFFGFKLLHLLSTKSLDFFPMGKCVKMPVPSLLLVHLDSSSSSIHLSTGTQLFPYIFAVVNNDAMSLGCTYLFELVFFYQYYAILITFMLFSLSLIQGVWYIQRSPAPPAPPGIAVAIWGLLWFHTNFDLFVFRAEMSLLKAAYSFCVLIYPALCLLIEFNAFTLRLIIGIWGLLFFVFWLLYSSIISFSICFCLPF